MARWPGNYQGRNSIREGLLRNAPALRQAQRAFKPYKPPPPPAGSYDPALDAAERASGRGLLDLQQDVGTANLRDTVDYGQQRGDIITQRDRGLADLLTSRTRGTEDHDRAVQMLSRQFGQLGNAQRQQQVRAGVVRGGAMLQAATKRRANEELERQPLDTSYQRMLDDSRESEKRIGDDSESQLGRLALLLAPPDEGNPFGGRAFQDRTTQLTRAQREGSAFGLDTGAQRAYQATGAGWAPPGRGEPGGMPRNEHVGAAGLHTRTIRQGGWILTVNPAGKVLKRKRA